MSAVYRKLFDSSVPIDWTTISLGWHGVGTGTYCCKLTAQDVIDIAADRLGMGTEEQDRLLSALANEDPTDWQTIGRYLEELRAGETSDEILAARRWRLAELLLLLDTGVEAALATEYDPQLELAELFADFWVSYDGISDSKGESPDFGYGVSVENQILAHQLWAKQEEAALKAEAAKVDVTAHESCEKDDT